MIPIRLELYNFLPYRAPDPVRFEGIHLACLTGANGAGKSSLLDAITWALWGRARTPRDDELVHLGQGEMRVQLDFEQEGTLYRVVRQRTRGKRGQSNLDLLVRQADGGFSTISEGSIRATQQRINDLLRLDYETFIHSAFLQQGKADAFTTLRPAERKKILSDILGLERWARYEEAVKGKLKEITGQLNFLSQRIDEIDHDLARRPALQDDLKRAETQHAAAVAARETAEASLQEVAQAPGDLKNARQNYEDRQARLREIERDLADADQRIDTSTQQIAAFQQVIDARTAIETGYAALQSARQADQALNEKLRRLRSLEDERGALHNQLTEARARLESEAAALRGRVDELRAQANADIQASLEEVQAEVDTLEAQQAEHDRLQAEISTMQAQRAGLEARLKAIEAEGQAERDRLERLQQANPEAAMCPLCGQPLDADHRAQLIAETDAGVQARRTEFRVVRDDVHALAERIRTENEHLRELTRDLKRLPPLNQRLGTLRQQAQTQQQAATDLARFEAELARITADLEADNYAAAVREQLAALDGQRAELGYDSDSHDDAQQTLTTHQQYEEMHLRLKIALESLPGAEAAREAAQARRDRLAEAASVAREDIDALQATIAELVALVAEYERRDQAVRTARTTEQTAYQRLIGAQQELKALDDQARYKADLINRQDGFRRQEAQYNDLRRAFGKDGVPAMVIETAIPELEVAANSLLSRMTDGRMHLRMNTQREKVTGGTMETLEIAIADELGERSYELFSGGEAFRINFAVRVALSQMLARRAGAHLRTLFIDEGFGTQDENGRDRLVEAITAIQDAFDMVLVITHIDELRDSFPVHIEVQKTGSGSRIAVR